MAGSILDHYLISSRYFFPRYAPLNKEFLVECNGIHLACYYAKPFPDGKTLVHFHGNGEIVADYIPDFVTSVTSLGVNCFLAEYRGYGGSTGSPALTRILEDIAPLLRAIQVPPEKLILFGRSIGSLYAIHGASLYPNLAGLIIESGIADVLERVLMRVLPDELGCTLPILENEVKAHFNLRAKLEEYKGPLLIMHAVHDQLVHVSNANLLNEWGRGTKRLKIFEDGDHNSILDLNYDVYFATLRSFFEELVF